MKTIVSLLTLGVASAAISTSVDLDMINDMKRVEKINAMDGILWKAGFNSRFDGKPLSSVKRWVG